MGDEEYLGIDATIWRRNQDSHRLYLNDFF